MKGSYDFKKIYIFFSYKWYFDLIYNRFINIPIIKYAYFKIFIILDKGLLEILGPYGVSEQLIKIGLNIKLDENGESAKYAIYIYMFFIFQIMAYFLIFFR
jgi:NADH-ubiquinone oxidoreductase chain 5